MTTSVVLKPKWPGKFCRTVYGEDKQPIERIEFESGSSVELTESQFAAVESDIGVALFLAKPNGKPDYEATELHVELRKESAAKAKKPKGKKQEG